MKGCAKWFKKKKIKIAKKILKVISKQDFAEWYGDGGEFEQYISGENTIPEKEILKWIQENFID